MTITEAMDYLCSKFENGHLMASSDPVGFLRMVADELMALREERERMLQAYYKVKLSGDNL